MSKYYMNVLLFYFGGSMLQNSNDSFVVLFHVNSMPQMENEAGAPSGYKHATGDQTLQTENVEAQK